MSDAKITVLVVEPERAPYAKAIDPGLESLQHEVGGYIQAIYPFEDPVAIIVDEEGKLKGKALNRSLSDDQGKIYDILTGTFLIAGLTEDNFGSLSDDLLQKYSAFFQQPELFIRTSRGIAAIPFDADPPRETSTVETKIQDAEKRAGSAKDLSNEPSKTPEPEL